MALAFSNYTLFTHRRLQLHNQHLQHYRLHSLSLRTDSAVLLPVAAPVVVLVADKSFQIPPEIPDLAFQSQP